MERGYTLKKCSKIIDVYCYMNKNEIFDMIGRILVIVPKPHKILNVQGHKLPSDELIEVIFDAYYDDWRLRGLLEGKGSLSSDFHGAKAYHGIPQYLADDYGAPQILVDENVSVNLDEDRAKWSVSINSVVGIYDLYDDVGFNEWFELFRDLLKSRYSNLNNLCITFLR